MSDTKKIALLLPLYEGRNHSPFLGMGYLSAVLRDAGYRTRIIDEDAVFSLMHEAHPEDPLRLTREFVASSLQDFAPDAIGVTINTTNYERGLELLGLVKEGFPDVPVIVGGPHISTSWRAFKKHHPHLFDVAVVGEGEKTIVEVCHHIFSGRSLDGLPGAVTLRTPNSAFRPPSHIEDLDCLPYPDREGFEKVFSSQEREIIAEHYRKVFYAHLPGFRGKKFARIVGSRGCTFSCSFCSPSVFWRDPLTGRPTRRLRNPRRIADEVESLYKKGYKAFYFDDPTFPFKSYPEFYKTFIDEIRQRNLKINWAAPTRYDELAEEILEELAESGFTYTYFGLETCQAEDLCKMGKATDVGQCLELIKWCNQVGIHCDVSYQIGLPGQGWDKMIKSIQWLEEHGLQKRSFFSLAAVWPETPLAKEFGISSEDFEPDSDKNPLEKRGLYFFKPGNPQIEKYFSNCSGTFHFIDEETAIRVKYYLMDAGFIKRFE